MAYFGARAVADKRWRYFCNSKGRSDCLWSFYMDAREVELWLLGKIK